jgi:hypothetical protein
MYYFLKKISLLCVLFLLGIPSGNSEMFSDSDVKTALYACGFEVDRQWFDFVEGLDQDEQEMLENLHRYKNIPQRLKIKLDQFHKNIELNLKQVLPKIFHNRHAYHLLSEHFAMRNSILYEFFDEGDSHNGGQFVQELASYFSSRSLWQRSRKGDKNLLSPPSLPLQMIRDTSTTHSIKMNNYSDMNQSSLQFQEKEGKAFDQAIDLKKYPTRSGVSVLKPLITVFIWNLLCQERGDVGSAQASSHLPGQYSLLSNETSPHFKNLVIYTCPGHSLVCLENNVSDICKGLYPVGQSSPLTSTIEDQYSLSANPLLIKDRYGPINAMVITAFLPRKGELVDETNYLTTGQLKGCQSVIVELTQPEETSVLKKLDQVAKSNDEGTLRYRVVGQNCVDFAQEVLESTGRSKEYINKCQNQINYNGLASAYQIYRQGGLFSVIRALL